jgi:hypothetical protein
MEQTKNTEYDSDDHFSAEPLKLAPWVVC